MADLNVIQGNVTADMTTDEARAITDRIKAAVEETWSLLLAAHERKAWAALGYPTWEEYVRGEFAMARRTSYQLLDQARVIRQIETAVSDVRHGAQIQVTEREARDIKPVLPKVADEIRERVTTLGPTPDPEQVKEVVREVVNENRAATRQKPARTRATTNIPRAVSAALADIDRARRELARLAPQVAHQNEEARRMWAANLSEQLEALTGFLNNL